MSESEEDTELDPRIQIELEKLNTTTDEINKLEIEYDEENKTFRMLLNECTRRLKILSKKLGNCIDKARPYYEFLEEAKKAQLECQEAAALYKKAHGIHAAAKETVALAEQRFMSNKDEWQFDNAWQEMLNHATMKVTEAENEKAERGREHHRKALVFKQIEDRLKQQEDKLQKHIAKSRPYFDEKVLCQEQLNTQKSRIGAIKQDIVDAKHLYAQTLKNLEQISNEIHLRRQGRRRDDDLLRRPREPGVGAELDATFEETFLPDVDAVLDKYGVASERDEDDEVSDDVLDVGDKLGDLDVRPVEGKSDDVFVSEFQLGQLKADKSLVLN